MYYCLKVLQTRKQLHCDILEALAVVKMNIAGGTAVQNFLDSALRRSQVLLLAQRTSPFPRGKKLRLRAVRDYQALPEQLLVVPSRSLNHSLGWIFGCATNGDWVHITIYNC